MFNKMASLWKANGWHGEEKKLLQELDFSLLPIHVAIIMDGNGRWARSRGLPRVAGHRAGVNSLKTVVRACSEIGIKMLTVYAFSTENWKRPEEEVNALMDLLVVYLTREIDELCQNQVRINAIGRIDELPRAAVEALTMARKKSGENKGLILNLALNYGGRTELVDAVRLVAAKVASGRLDAGDVDEKVIGDHLYIAGMPDPDLMIRPAGDMRISNFLLWQSAYTEFWFTPVMWPDFKRLHLLHALLDFQKRERRYGGLMK